MDGQGRTGHAAVSPACGEKQDASQTRGTVGPRQGRAGQQELDDLHPEHLELQKCDVSIQGALRKLSGRERKGRGGEGGAVVQPLLTFFFSVILDDDLLAGIMGSRDATLAIKGMDQPVGISFACPQENFFSKKDFLRKNGEFD